MGLRLGAVTLSEDAGSGAWKLAPDAVQNFQAEITRLQQHVASLESKVGELRQRNTRTTEQKLLVEFKNQLLTELLAVAQLDAEKNHKIREEAEVKVEALKWELVNLIKGRDASVYPSAVEEGAGSNSDGRVGERSEAYKSRRLTPPPRRHKTLVEEL